MSRQTGPPCPPVRDPRPWRSKQTRRPRSQQAPGRPPPSGDASFRPPLCRFVRRRFEGGLDRPRICLIPNPDNVCHKEYDSGGLSARSNRRRRFTREPMMATRDEKTTPKYEQFRELFTRRMSMRDLRPDPVPDSYVDKILEAGRWAMSGANSQPWEFIVVRDPPVKQALVDAYVDVNNDFIFWMEQMRLADLRHPAFQVQGDPAEQWQRVRTRHAAWGKAPVLIVILGDGRRQWGTVLGAMTFGRHHPRPGTVQARARRARSPDDPPHPADRLFRHRSPPDGPAPP